MRHAVYRPTAPLDRLIDFLWVADDYQSQTPRERVLPTGSQALVVLLGASAVRIYDSCDAAPPVEAAGAVVCGARQTPLIIGTSLGPTVGVHFKPGGARAFFDTPAEGLAERAVCLEDLWGRGAHALREQLLDAAEPAAQVRVLEAFLLERAAHVVELPAVLRAALAAFDEPGLTSVAEVNRRTGLSPKRLLALFRERVGLSPKTFWRVRRFRSALRGLDNGARGAALAQELGYFDQAHFLREFRALAGSTPSEFLATRVAGTDHVSVFR